MFGTRLCPTGGEAPDAHAIDRQESCDVRRAYGSKHAPDGSIGILCRVGEFDENLVQVVNSTDQPCLEFVGLFSDVGGSGDVDLASSQHSFRIRCAGPAIGSSELCFRVLAEVLKHIAIALHYTAVAVRGRDAPRLDPVVSSRVEVEP